MKKKNQKSLLLFTTAHSERKGNEHKLKCEGKNWLKGSIMTGPCTSRFLPGRVLKPVSKGWGTFCSLWQPADLYMVLFVTTVIYKCSYSSTGIFENCHQCPGILWVQVFFPSCDFPRIFMLLTCWENFQHCSCDSNNTNSWRMSCGTYFILLGSVSNHWTGLKWESLSGSRLFFSYEFSFFLYF